MGRDSKPVARFALAVALALTLTAGAQKPADVTPPAPAFKDLNALMRALPSPAAPTLDEPRAIWFAALPLGCVDELQPRPPARTYFWQPTFKAVDRYEKTRAFYGCGDWPSAVGSTWTLVRLLKQFPQLSVQAIAREKLNDHLAKENLEGELAYVRDVPQFQRPYGWAWLLKLQAELLTWKDREAEKWASQVAPLAGHMAEALIPFLDDLERANKTASQANTALSLKLMLDYTAVAHASALERAVASAAHRFYDADTNCPTDKEATTPEMVSPCLIEAALMSQILEPPAFLAWLDKFLPAAHSPAFTPLLSVAIDRPAGGRRGGRGAAAAAPPSGVASAALRRGGESAGGGRRRHGPWRTRRRAREPPRDLDGAGFHAGRILSSHRHGAAAGRRPRAGLSSPRSDSRRRRDAFDFGTRDLHRPVAQHAGRQLHSSVGDREMIKSCLWHTRPRGTVARGWRTAAILVSVALCAAQSLAAGQHAQAQPPAAGGVVFKDLESFFKSLPRVEPGKLDERLALELAAMPLSCVDWPHARPTARGYLWEATHRPPDDFEKTRAFYGCFDWHSAVNSTWALVKTLKMFPSVTVGPLARAKLERHLGKSNIEGEVDYFKDAGAFELPVRPCLGAEAAGRAARVGRSGRREMGCQSRAARHALFQASDRILHAARATRPDGRASQQRACDESDVRLPGRRERRTAQGCRFRGSQNGSTARTRTVRRPPSRVRPISSLPA